MKIIQKNQVLLPLILSCASSYADEPVKQPADPSETATVAAEQTPKLTIPTADAAEAVKARDALEAFIRAYEMGNYGYIHDKIDIAMIGYQRFLEGVQRDQTNLKQIRVHLFDTQVLAGPDMAVIQTGWEKRFLGAMGLTPGIFSGRSTFLMHRHKDEWRIAAFGGDNLFSSQSGVLATLTTNPSRIPCFPGLCISGILSIELIDPDLAGLASVQVQITTTNGDRETRTLTAISPGRFQGTANYDPTGGVSVGNGTVDVGGIPGSISVLYRDQNPGSGRPSSNITRTIYVGP